MLIRAPSGDSCTCTLLRSRCRTEAAPPSLALARSGSMRSGSMRRGLLRSRLNNEGQDCSIPCNSEQGLCTFCGHGGACCEYGHNSSPPECGSGSLGCTSKLCCTALKAAYRIQASAPSPNAEPPIAPEALSVQLSPALIAGISVGATLGCVLLVALVAACIIWGMRQGQHVQKLSMELKQLKRALPKRSRRKPEDKSLVRGTLVGGSPSPSSPSPPLLLPSLLKCHSFDPRLGSSTPRPHQHHRPRRRHRMARL